MSASRSAGAAARAIRSRAMHPFAQRRFVRSRSRATAPMLLPVEHQPDGLCFEVVIDPVDVEDGFSELFGRRCGAPFGKYRRNWSKPRGEKWGDYLLGLFFLTT